MTDNWRRLAKCAEIIAQGMADYEDYFTADTSFELKARLIRISCGICPVRRECLRDNLYTPYGLYGGLNWRDRRRLIYKRTGRMPKYGALGFFSGAGRTSAYYEAIHS